MLFVQNSPTGVSIYYFHDIKELFKYDENKILDNKDKHILKIDNMLDNKYLDITNIQKFLINKDGN